MINTIKQKDEQFAEASLSKSQENLKRGERERQFCQCNEYNTPICMPYTYYNLMEIEVWS